MECICCSSLQNQDLETVIKFKNSFVLISCDYNSEFDGNVYIFITDWARKKKMKVLDTLITFPWIKNGGKLCDDCVTKLILEKKVELLKTEYGPNFPCCCALCDSEFQRPENIVMQKKVIFSDEIDKPTFISFTDCDFWIDNDLILKNNYGNIRNLPGDKVNTTRENFKSINDVKYEYIGDRPKYWKPFAQICDFCILTLLTNKAIQKIL